MAVPQSPRARRMIQKTVMPRASARARQVASPNAKFNRGTATPAKGRGTRGASIATAAKTRKAK